MRYRPLKYHAVEQIEPGQCVLIRQRRSQSQILLKLPNYSLAVVCTESMVPTKTARLKPAVGVKTQNGHFFPVWLIGKSEFFWLTRAQMFHLNEWHNEEWKRADPNSDFTSYFTLAKEYSGNLEFWTKVILEHKKKVDAREGNLSARTGQKHPRERSSSNDLSSKETTTEDSDDSHLEDSGYEGPVRKKSRSTTTKAPVSDGEATTSAQLTASTPPPCMVGPPSRLRTPAPTPYTTPAASSQDGGIIKPEPSDEDDAILIKDVVQVFVGQTNNAPFECSRASLAQSAILTERITTRPGGQPCSFIMDPTFSDMAPSDFKAVVQFLNANEYEPLLLTSPDGTLALDESAAPINYAADLVRSARLFNLAKRLQLPAFGHLVFCKILHGHRSYDMQPFLAFATLILTYRGSDFGDGDAIKGLLEEWVVKFLAEHMHTMCSRTVRDARAFWELMAVKGVEARVMEMRLKLCRQFPGGRIKIED